MNGLNRDLKVRGSKKSSASSPSTFAARCRNNPPMSRYFQYAPYVPVAQRRANAAKAAVKLEKKFGRKLSPVAIEGRLIAKTFWGKAWCDNLESYSDYANRLPRGRTYARNGSVIDLHIGPGEITALVQGSSLYTENIAITPLSKARWEKFVKSAAGQVSNLLDLLQGRLSKELLESISAKGDGLFPSPREIKLNCNCPDGAGMCKHLAAVLYGVGARLDHSPELLFTLRGVDMQDLVTAAGETATAPLADSAFDDENLSSIFGVEIESSTPVSSKKVTAKKAATKKSIMAKKAPARKNPAKKIAVKKVPSARAKLARKAKPPLTKATKPSSRRLFG